MKKEDRLKRIRVRKNFLFSLIIIIILWTLLGAIVYLSSPEEFKNILLFLLLVFIALFFTLATLLESKRRGFLAAFGLTILLVLRYLQIDNLFNLLLITGVIVSAEVYYKYRKI